MSAASAMWLRTCSHVGIYAAATLHALVLLSLVRLDVNASHGDPRLRTDAFIGYVEKNGDLLASDCSDREANCNLWKDNKECLLNPNFMRAACARSCGSCKSIEARPRQKIRGSITAADSKQFSVLYPAAAIKPVGQSHFRYDPSMSDLEQLGDAMRTRPWITLGSLGVGTYLGDEDDATDEQVISSIVKSVAHGCNVIDTARNYRGGRGELSVGRALAMLVRHNIRRKSLFVSTKAGFLPETLRRELLAAGKVGEGDIVGGHCMHPACLEASLEQSLAALNLETVDLLHLHNPAEMQLEALGRETFLARLAVAFRALEKLRASGKIRAYGLATWSCFRVAPEASGYLSLQKVHDLAVAEAGKQHGFRYVQLPINAAMREAWQQPWQTVAQPGGGPQTLPFTAAAARLGVGVMASGPLSQAALLKETGLLARLQAAPAVAGDAGINGGAAAALQLARSTPYVITAIVGHKAPDHVEGNLHVIRTELLDRQAFVEVFDTES